jgi:hypothetical protein
MALFITLLWGLSCALSPTAAESTVTYPATVEFDVVFPANKTYAPAPVFPIVFAVQNLAAATPSTLIQIQWTLIKINEYRIHTDLITMPNTNSSDLYYINLWTSWLNGTASAGAYGLSWEFTYNNCTEPGLDVGVDTGFEGLTRNFTRGSFEFTIEPGAQQPDLGADLDACPAQNATIEITGTMPVRWEPLQPRHVCGILATEQPPATPCVARMNEAAASSIAAELTASACATGLSTPPALTIGCPPPTQTTEKSLGSRAHALTEPSVLMRPIMLAGLLLLVLH